MYTISYGLASLLTPPVFHFILIVPILFERLGRTRNTHKTNIILFTLLTIVLFLAISSGLSNKSSSMDFYKQLTTFANSCWLLGMMWLLLGFTKKFAFLQNHKIAPIINGFVIILFSFKLAMGSLASAGPLITPLIVSEVSNAKLITLITSMFWFVIGLLLPFMFILYLLQFKYNTLSSKKWWNILQIIIIILLIVNSVVFLLD